MYKKMTTLIDARDYSTKELALGEVTHHVSKSDVSYSKIPIMYGGGQFLLRVPRCKTVGVQTMEMESGYTRKTMPLVLDDEESIEQVELVAAFKTIVQDVFDEMYVRGYQQNRLTKLGGCFWGEKVLYASVTESVFDTRNNTRYFVKGKEVARVGAGEGKEYEATAAVLIDSIYVGQRTVSIQVKLYEVNLAMSSKRGRVL